MLSRLSIPSLHKLLLRECYRTKCSHYRAHCPILYCLCESGIYFFEFQFHHTAPEKLKLRRVHWETLGNLLQLALCCRYTSVASRHYCTSETCPSIAHTEPSTSSSPNCSSVTQPIGVAYNPQRDLLYVVSRKTLSLLDAIIADPKQLTPSNLGQLQEYQTILMEGGDKLLRALRRLTILGSVYSGVIALMNTYSLLFVYRLRKRE